LFANYGRGAGRVSYRGALASLWNAISYRAPSVNLFLGTFDDRNTDAYHWAYETYSGRGLSLFQSSLTHNIADGHLGLTGSYGRGNDEDTGVLSNIYKISLTGKL
jgi:hypothetical protein